MINCDKCKTENEDSADFCEHCGDKLVPKTLCCPDCGLYNKATAKFCNSCGTNLITGKAKEWILDNRYEILGIIKSGAMGAVYQALDQRLGIKVAVKKLFNNGGNADEILKSQEMFKREASILSSLHHSCLPKVNDYFSASDETGRNSNFIVMSLIQGEDLETYLGRNKPPLPLEKATDYILKVSDILQYLHSQTPPVIHRDLKPSSIMLSNGSFFLVDFGIAKALEGNRTGTMIGTPGYASPDQCRGNDHISNDIYSLGALFHYLLTGRDPERQTNNLFTFEPVRKTNSQIPEHIDTLIASMVEMRITDRPGSIDEVRERLTSVVVVKKTNTTAQKTTQPIIPQQPKISEEEFLKAVKKGDIEKVEIALAQGVNVNIKNKDGWTPLYWVAGYGHIAVAELLIKNGADVNTKTNGQWTSLHRAACNGHISMAKLLISEGADINAQDKYGYTPLNRVASGRYTDMIELLISLGACANEKDIEEFFNGVKNGNIDKVKIAFAQGVDINNKNRDGLTPLHWAASKGHTNVAELLISKGADVNAKDNEGRTPLYWASSKGHTNLVQLLIARGAKTDTTVKKASPPPVNLIPQISEDEFFNAVEKGDIYKVKTALAQGMSVNIKDRDGWTPLHLAASNGQIILAALLITMGIDINAKDNDGWTPLYIAAVNGHTDMVELLISKGADVNAKTNTHWTSLHRAVNNGHTSIVKLLISGGADVNAKDVEGCTPLHIAASKGHTDIAELLISKGVHLNEKDNDGRIPLHYAASEGYIAIVELIVFRGKNVDMKDKSGWTSLHIAASNAHVDVAKLLVSIGANVNEKGFNGWTPLHLAVCKEHVAVVEFLISKGADVNSKTKDGETPLQKALSFSISSMVELLRKHGGC